MRKAMLKTICAACWIAGAWEISAGAGDRIATGGPPSTESKASGIIERYLKMPYPEEDRVGEARMARLKVLDELKGVPGVPEAIGAALQATKDPLRRRELVEALRHFPGRASADLLTKLLDDPDDGVRWETINVLRMYSRRIDRVGPERRVLQKDLVPSVEGLVPVLIKAAGDRSENCRVTALYALADSLDPAAVDELRRRLDDPSDQVRLHAACFLTEYHDATGLPEMRKALDRLREGKRDDFRRYGDSGLLLSSFERITGKSFGPLPLNPLLHSIIEKGQEAEATYERLIETWAAWWAWEPPSKR